MFSSTRFYKIIFISAIGLVALFTVIFISLLVIRSKQKPNLTDSVDSATKISRTSAPKSKKFRLYFVRLETSELVAEERDIELSKDYIESIKKALNKLIEGSATGLLNPIPRDTTLREVFFEEKPGCVYVDFSETLSKSHPGGTTGELLTIQSIIKTLQANFPEIQKVQILIDGKDVNTIAGHIDISQPLSVE